MNAYSGDNCRSFERPTKGRALAEHVSESHVNRIVKLNFHLALALIPHRLNNMQPSSHKILLHAFKQSF